MQIYKRFTVGLLSDASFLLCLGRRIGIIVMKLPQNVVLGVLPTETRPLFVI